MGEGLGRISRIIYRRISLDRMPSTTGTQYPLVSDIRFPYTRWRSAVLIAILLSLTLTVPARAAGPAVLVKDITAAVNPTLDSSPDDIVAIGNVLYFTADDRSTGRE